MDHIRAQALFTALVLRGCCAEEAIAAILAQARMS